MSGRAICAILSPASFDFRVRRRTGALGNSHEFGGTCGHAGDVERSLRVLSFADYGVLLAPFLLVLFPVRNRARNHSQFGCPGFRACCGVVYLADSRARLSPRGSLLSRLHAASLDATHYPRAAPGLRFRKNAEDSCRRIGPDHEVIHRRCGLAVLDVVFLACWIFTLVYRHAVRTVLSSCPIQRGKRDSAGPDQQGSVRACMARMQKSMCSSTSTPISAAPRIISSRLIARANALSFSFLRTLFASTSAMLRPGFTYEHAVRKPASSSQP